MNVFFRDLIRIGNIIYNIDIVDEIISDNTINNYFILVDQYMKLKKENPDIDYSINFENLSISILTKINNNKMLVSDIYYFRHKLKSSINWFHKGFIRKRK